MSGVTDRLIAALPTTQILRYPDHISSWLARRERAFDVRLGDDRLWAVCVGLTIAFQFALIFTHQPWLDEWQALLIAQESPTLTDMIANLRYEGHPPLWHLSLRALAVIIPIYWVLPVAAAIAALCTHAILFLRMPFTRLQRLLVATGYFMLFDYLTISRSLTLGVMGLVLFMAMRDRKIAWLWLALLPLCDFLFGVLSIAMIIVQWRDRRLWAPGMALWAVASAFAAWSVIPAPDILPAIKSDSWFWSYNEFFEHLAALLIPVQFNKGRFMWNGTWPLGLGHLGGIMLLVFAWKQVAGDWLQRSLLAGFVVLTFAFSMLVYPLQTRHLSLIAFLLILLKWREAERGNALRGSLRLWLAVSSTCGVGIGLYNFVVPFDTGYLAAQEIVERGLADKQWLTLEDPPGPGLHALTGMDFREVQNTCSESFIRWNHDVSINTTAQLELYLRSEIRRHGRLYLLTSNEPNLPLSLVKPITHIPPGYDGQGYYLSMVGPGFPETGAQPSWCVPRRRALDQGTIWSAMISR